MSKEAVFKFSLGDSVKDNITGYEGIVIARTDWLNACKTYMIKSRKLHDNKPIDSVSFDEANLVLVESQAIKDKPVKENGGAAPAVSRNTSVSR